MEIITGFPQHSAEWYAVRRGRITMSRAGDLLTGGKGVTRASYLQEVASEILSDDDGADRFVSNDMARGIELERFAVRAYESASGLSVNRVAFVVADDARIGASPDGLTDSGGLEIKCPRPKNHLRYLNRINVERDHGQQMQGGMWVCQRDHWAFVSFCPWVQLRPLIVHVFDRDEELIAKIAESASRGADEVEAMVKAVTDSAPHDGIAQIAKDAMEWWDRYNLSMSGDVTL